MSQKYTGIASVDAERGSSTRKRHVTLTATIGDDGEIAIASEGYEYGEGRLQQAPDGTIKGPWAGRNGRLCHAEGFAEVTPGKMAQVTLTVNREGQPILDGRWNLEAVQAPAKVTGSSD